MIVAYDIVNKTVSKVSNISVFFGDSLDSQPVALVSPLEEQLVDVLLPVEQCWVDELSVEQPGAPADDDDEADQHSD